MEDSLNIKIQHYCGHVNLTVDNYKKGNYPDAAINARKCAEAACKIIIFHTLTLKRAEEKIKDKSLKDLIMILVRDGLAERKIINTIEALQITGNKAAHDNVISKGEASYALNALNLLTDNLFAEHLKIKVPSSVSFSIETKKEKIKKTPQVIEKIIVEERLVSKTLDAEQEKALIEKIRGINEAEKRSMEIALPKEEPKTAMPEKVDEEKVPEPVIPSGRERKSTKTLWLVGATLFILLLIAGLLFFYPAREKNPGKIFSGGDTVNIAISAFEILQDNPMLSFSITDALRKEIGKKMASRQLPYRIQEENFSKKLLEGDSAMLVMAAGMNYDLVYWGSLYENALDSNLLEIKGCLTAERRFFRNKKIRFRSAADSVFIKEINDQANSAPYSYCHKKAIHRQAADTIARILDGLITYSSENWVSMKYLEAQALLKAEQFEMALPIVRELYRRWPKESLFMEFVAGTFVGLSMYDSAEVYYLKLANIKKDRVGLLRLANFYLLKNDTASARAYTIRILAIDSKDRNAIAISKKLASMGQGSRFYTGEYLRFRVKGDSLAKKKQWKESIRWRKLAYDVTPNKAYEYARISEAMLLTGDKRGASDYLSRAWEEDSTEITTVVFHQDMSLKSDFLDAKGDYYQRYAMALFPRNEIILETASDYYFVKKQYAKCVEVGLTVENLKIQNNRIIKNTGVAAYEEEQYPLARRCIEFVNTMDPTDDNMLMLSRICLMQANGNSASEPYRRGVEVLKKLQRLYPRNLQVNRLAQSYVSLKTPPGPNKSVELSPKQQANFGKGMNMNLRPGSEGQKILYSSASLTVTTGKGLNVINCRQSNGASSHYHWAGQGNEVNLREEEDILEEVLARAKKNKLLENYLEVELDCSKRSYERKKTNTYLLARANRITRELKKLKGKNW